MVRDITVRAIETTAKIAGTASTKPTPKKSDKGRGDRSDAEPKQNKSERKYLGDDQPDAEARATISKRVVPFVSEVILVRK